MLCKFMTPKIIWRTDNKSPGEHRGTIICKNTKLKTLSNTVPLKTDDDTQMQRHKYFRDTLLTIYLKQGRIPLKLEKLWFIWHKIVIFHTKYPNNFRASLSSAQFFLSAPPLTWNPGSAPVSMFFIYLEKSKKNQWQTDYFLVAYAAKCSSFRLIFHWRQCWWLNIYMCIKTEFIYNNNLIKIRSTHLLPIFYRFWTQAT